jgi:outer membrane protein TolC
MAEKSFGSDFEFVFKRSGEMRHLILCALCAATPAFAQSALTLNQYLDDVRSHNPEARAAIDNVESYEARRNEAESPLMTEFYGTWNKRDDKKPTQVPAIFGTETAVEQWRTGFRKQTDFGLGADLYFNSQRTTIVGASPTFLPVADYMEASAVLGLTQSLWRNGFGEGTRAQIEAQRAANDINLLQSRFQLKNILLNAENAYWSVVSFNQVVKLQQENVERARKLRDYMSGRARMKLFDDTDAMQAQAAFESRELELQNSLDERAVLIRQFNTLRGLDSDQIQSLDGLPTNAMMSEVHQPVRGKMTREDFDMLRAQARAGVAQAKYANSQIQPQLDLVASVATNGRDGTTPEAYQQTETNHYPTWSVGVNFSVPLDFGMISDIRRGYRKASAAADDLHSQAQFSEVRAWDDLNQQKKEAQGRYDRSLSVERIQTELVKREHTRLINGRATTFEALNFEQNLALAQIQRVQSQLFLLKIYNAIKTFEAKP